MYALFHTANPRSLTKRQKELLQEFVDDVEGARPVTEALRQSRAKMQDKKTTKTKDAEKPADTKKAPARPIWGGELGPQDEPAGDAASKTKAQPDAQGNKPSADAAPEDKSKDKSDAKDKEDKTGAS